MRFYIMNILSFSPEGGYRPINGSGHRPQQRPRILIFGAFNDPGWNRPMQLHRITAGSELLQTHNVSRLDLTGWLEYGNPLILILWLGKLGISIINLPRTQRCQVQVHICLFLLTLQFSGVWCHSPAGYLLNYTLPTLPLPPLICRRGTRTPYSPGHPHQHVHNYYYFNLHRRA